MRLEPFSQYTTKLIDRILEVDARHCKRSSGGSCPEDQIAQLIAEAIQNAPYSFLKNECEFIKCVAAVQTDGRNCFGYEQQKRIKDLVSSDRWRADRFVVIAGIRLGQVELTQHDLEVLNTADNIDPMKEKKNG